MCVRHRTKEGAHQVRHYELFAESVAEKFLIRCSRRSILSKPESVRP